MRARAPASTPSPTPRRRAAAASRCATRDGTLLGGAGRPLRPRHAGLDRGAPARRRSATASRTGRHRGLPAQQEAQLRALDGFSKDQCDATSATATAGDLLRDAPRGRQHGGQAGHLDALRRAEGRRERHPPRVAPAAASPSSTASTACSPPAQSVPGTELAEQVISRIKVMSELDIAERRVPQDGRFKARARAAATSTSASRSCRACSARTRCCASSTARRCPTSCTGLTLESLAFETELKHRLRELSTAALRHAAGHRPDRQRQDHHAVRGDHARSTRATTRSSPSRTRSSTSCRACCRSR